jgi:hypothetical protein
MARVLTLLMVLLATPVATTLLTVTADDCATITAHVPADDVAYQPDADVNYNPSGQLNIDPNDVVVSIDIALRATDGVVGDEAAFIANGGQIDMFGANASVGVVTLRDGDVYFDGQRISDHQQTAIAEACAEQQGN